MQVKKIAADAAVEKIENGMVVGLGSGTTSHWAIKRIGERVKEGLQIRAIATSNESEALAKELNIPIVTFAEFDHIDITIDGADEVDPDLNLIKGGGGALMREKIVAAASHKFLVIVDESKLVTHLGKFPLPVEVLPFGLEMTRRKIESLGCQVTIRAGKNQYFITDNGNYILDCEFGTINNPTEMNKKIYTIPGVVDHGLFIQMADKIFVGYRSGEVQVIETTKSVNKV
ncbi:MAG: ribose-5-phosphate isomerase RpiA [Bacteroidetes bacterium]|jgi:ribose 5-phosphate isomerase A|nr:ribose-5-phosphate isomerase RpiA [Bacteroidota bacterium]